MERGEESKKRLIVSKRGIDRENRPPCSEKNFKERGGSKTSWIGGCVYFSRNPMARVDLKFDLEGEKKRAENWGRTFSEVRIT